MPDKTTLPLQIRRMSAADTGFFDELSKLVAWSAVSNAALENSVREIMHTVRDHGDTALTAYTQKFDSNPASDFSELVVEQEQMQAALQSIDSDLKRALDESANRIRSFHERQLQKSWQYTDAEGVLLGQQITALDRVGIYVPGGKAAYPSSVLMNAIPAKVAGVSEIIMTSPAPAGELNSVVLAAAAISGVNRFFILGGAQAIAALAYGTESVPRVDKIVGPGNRYVACAKKMVFGEVGLDMVAGPSEILVVCDGKTDPDWIAMDLFSQAEHDEDAQAILLSTDANFLDAVDTSMQKLLQQMERADIIAASVNRRSAFIKVKDRQQAQDVINKVAPEHLELSVDDPQAWLPGIRHAGAIFLGRYTPEAFGDYCAGPNHVLPTSTTARFASPLGVYDFQKRSSIIQCSPEAAARLADTASVLARSESLTAHARSAEYRGTKQN